MTHAVPRIILACIVAGSAGAQEPTRTVGHGVRTITDRIATVMLQRELCPDSGLPDVLAQLMAQLTDEERPAYALAYGDSLEKLRGKLSHPSAKIGLRCEPPAYATNLANAEAWMQQLQSNRPAPWQ